MHAYLKGSTEVGLLNHFFFSFFFGTAALCITALAEYSMMVSENIYAYGYLHLI